MKLNRVLTIGMDGEDIRFMQSKLVDFGFSKDKINGYFGQNTLISVTNFQRSVGIKPDGSVGIMMWNKLIHYNTSPKSELVLTPVVLDIPFDKSHTGQNGFKIYDYLLSEEEYIKKESRKETIWLHGSSGGSRPDYTIGSWGIPKTAMHYVIGRKSSSSDDSIWDGKVIRAFDDKYWAYHLEIEDDLKKEELNSKSISIEICNYGFLTPGKDGRLYNCVNKPVSQSEVVEADYRGYQYWEKYTDTQLESTRNLILYLQGRWGIEIQKGIYNETWFDYNQVWIENGGLRSYGQARRDVYDIFPQKEMMQMLNSL